MSFKNILVITDNETQYHRFKKIVESRGYDKKKNIVYKHSINKTSIHQLPEFINGNGVIDVKLNVEKIINNFDLIFSIHCYQFFPPQLVNSVRCINIHPGYNPINRGWYPQVFAIINNLELGATIHEMDEKLDNGRIIDRKKIEIYPWDTSLSVYDRVLLLEAELLEKNIENIFENNYSTIVPEGIGNMFTKKDFNNLCKLDLDEVTTYKQAIDKLRALTHGNYKNAWFIDEKTGQKIYVSLNIETNE